MPNAGFCPEQQAGFVSPLSRKRKIENRAWKDKPDFKARRCSTHNALDDCGVREVNPDFAG